MDDDKRVDEWLENNDGDVLGIPGSISLDDGMEYCEIIQSICPYSHGCSICRLHGDYEKAKEKSAELMKKKECTL